MIEQSDWVLVAVIVTVAVLVTSLLWIAFGSQRTWDLKLEHEEAIRVANAEITAVRGKLVTREIRDRVLGSVPVGRLLDRGDDE